MRRLGWTAAGAITAAALGAAAALRARRGASAPPPEGPATASREAPGSDPVAALDAARERLRRRAADLRAEMQSRPPEG